MLEAVDLDVEPRLRPEEVRFIAQELRVDQRVRQIELEEQHLVARPGPGAAGPIDLDRPVEDVEVVAAVRARHRISDRRLHEPPSECRLLDHRRDLVRRSNVAEIHQQAMHRGDRDATLGRDVARVQPPDAVDADSGRRSTVMRDDHVDQTGARPRQPVQFGRRAVTQRRAADGEDGREPFSLA